MILAKIVKIVSAYSFYAIDFSFPKSRLIVSLFISLGKHIRVDNGGK